MVFFLRNGQKTKITYEAQRHEYIFIPFNGCGNSVSKRRISL